MARTRRYTATRPQQSEPQFTRRTPRLQELGRTIAAAMEAAMKTWLVGLASGLVLLGAGCGGGGGSLGGGGSGTSSSTVTLTAPPNFTSGLTGTVALAATSSD